MVRAIRLMPVQRSTPEDEWLRFAMPAGFVTCATILGLRASEIDAIRVRSMAFELASFESFTTEGERYTAGEAAQLLWELGHAPSQRQGLVSIDLADGGAGVRVGCQGEAWLQLRLVPKAVVVGRLAVAFQVR